MKILSVKLEREERGRVYNTIIVQISENSKHCETALKNYKVDHFDYFGSSSVK